MGLQFKQGRWKRWAAGTAGVLAVYSAAGWWLVPQLVRSQLPRFAHDALQRRASVGAVSFNPWTLRLEARDLRLDEADGAPLFGLGQLALELNWRSLPLRAWSLAEVRLTAPSVHLSVAPDGGFNLAAFLDTLARRPHQPSEGLPRLAIARFVLERGKVDMHDHRARYDDTFAPIELALDNLSTLPDENGHYWLRADAGHGGKLSWNGTAALNPLAGSGVLTLDNVALPGLAAYLKSFWRVNVVDGKLSATLPYRYGVRDGRLDASLVGAALSLHGLALFTENGAKPFATLAAFEMRQVDADLARRAVTLGALRVDGGTLALRRDARGQLDLTQLGVAAPEAVPAAAPPIAAVSASAPAPAPALVARVQPAAAPAGWQIRLKQLDIDRFAVNAVDDSVSPALKLATGPMQLRLQLDARQGDGGWAVKVGDAAFALSDLRLSSGARTALTLGRLGFAGGEFDLAARRAMVTRVYAEGGQLDLSRGADGRFWLASLLARPDTVMAASGGAGIALAGNDTLAGKDASSVKDVLADKHNPADKNSPALPWQAEIRSVELSKFGADIDDAGSGVKTALQDVSLSVQRVGSDLARPLPFSAGASLREGGRVTAQGRLVPATGAVDAELVLSQLALAPLQPLLAQRVKLHVAGGVVNARGRLSAGAGIGMRYKGSFEVANLALDEDDGDRFLSWRSVGTDKLTLGLGPDLLDIAELRVVEPNATLMIENDRSFNAERLLVRQATVGAAQGVAGVPGATGAGFPVRVRRVLLDHAKLAFTDLSLRPQFTANIYELGGVITGLSTQRDGRSQVELDGRVDDYGMARVRGQLNPLVLSDNTDLTVAFKNVDMVAVSPYSMKFAGYQIAEGKISLDLQYRVRNGQLDGNNRVVLDRLTLGARSDSPDATKLPLELALAILKDQDGRIDLGVPVSGDLNDPHFNYGALAWKAVGNVLAKVATSPFHALGKLLGVSGEQLEHVEFDAGSAALLPPERDKLRQVAQLLSRRAQLALSVPGQYSIEADGAALRAVALRRQLAQRAGVGGIGGDSAEDAPRHGTAIDTASRKVRGAIRALYAERFGVSELEQRRNAAENAAKGSGNGSGGSGGGISGAGGAEIIAGSTGSVAASLASAGAAPVALPLPLWRRVGNLVQGEPQLADTAPFYQDLLRRLEQGQPLPADVLPALGLRRSTAILAALKEQGIQAAAGPAEAVAAEANQSVRLALGLSAKESAK